MPQAHGSTRRQTGLAITKEFLIGLIAIAIGGYNLYYLYTHKQPIISLDVTHSFADIILVIAGLILLLTAYKLWRLKWHTRGLF